MYKLNTVVWEITLSCNINCIHCASNADIHKRPKELSTGEAFSLIEQLADIGCKRIILSGGEPFMRKDWSALASRIVSFGMECNFISNGFAVNDETISLLKEIGIRYLGFSLDGATAKMHDYIRGKEGVFDHLMEVFDKLKKEKIMIAAVSTIHKGNIGEMEGIKNLLLDHQVDVWQIQTANIRGRMPKEWAVSDVDFYNVAKFIAENRKRYQGIINITEGDCIGYYSVLTPNMGIKKWNGCGGGIDTLGIRSDGKITGCLSMQDDIYIEGSIREKPLKEIWNDPNAFKYNRRFEMSDLSGICAECKYGAICRGGCSDRSMTYSGKLHSQPYCLYDMEKRGKV